MRNNKTVRYTIAYLALLAVLAILLVANICMGSVSITLPEVLGIIFGKNGSDVNMLVIWDIRMPRALSALLLGGALAEAGYLMQTFFANPIAGPYVLGISSGAKLVVALVMIFALGYGISISSGLMIMAAFVGSMLVMGFILILSKSIKRMSILIIAGVMVGYICTAITDFLVTFANDANIVNLHNWSMGSFSGIGWSEVSVMFVVIVLAVIVTFLLSKPLLGYQMGESYAKSMGVNVDVLRVLLILISSFLSACVTAFAGPVSFVGIAMPHIARKIYGTGKPIILIPAVFMTGSIFCLFCDLIARLMFAPTELSISSVTAIFGAPIVIAILLGRSRKKEG